LLCVFDEEYKRLEFHTDSYKDLPDDIKQKLYNYVVLKEPLSVFLKAICTNNRMFVGRTKPRYSCRSSEHRQLRAICTNNLSDKDKDKLISDKTKDKLIRKVFLWFYNVCPGNMYGYENYKEFEMKYIEERKKAGLTIN
jgi:hypothetical protein